MSLNIRVKDGGSRLSAPNRDSIVSVDDQKCRDVAALLKCRDIPADKEEHAPPVGFSAEEVGNLYLMLVAICHQTSPRDHEPLEGTIGAQQFRGWDYLSAKLLLEANANREVLLPSFWSKMTAPEVTRLFGSNGARGALTDPEGRAVLIQDLGLKMLQRSWNCAGDFYAFCGKRIATATPNLVETLSAFRAYDDPVRKKTYFFLALMRNNGLWTYSDPENLGAPIDYHEIRGHLRIGTVRICDPELYLKVLKDREITREEDICIREAVDQALKLISNYSGIRNESQLHYLFWNIFRSCCTRDDAHCAACPPNCPLPERYIPLNLFPVGPRRCAFSKVCLSAGRDVKLLEPRVITDYY